MTTVLCSAWLFTVAHLATPNATDNGDPLASRASLAVTTDRASYYPREPIHLTVTVRNDSQAPLRAKLTLLPAASRLEVWYRRVGSRFVRWGCKPVPGLGHGVVVSKPLEPGQERSNNFYVLFDGATNRFVLDAPGRYEIKAVYREARDDANALLEAREVGFEVIAAPSSEAEALDRFSSPALGELAQWHHLNYYVDPVPAEVLQQAEQFLDDHGDGPYGDHLRRGLLAYLQYTKGGGGNPAYSAYHQRLYKKVAKEPPPAPMPTPRTSPEP